MWEDGLKIFACSGLKAKIEVRCLPCAELEGAVDEEFCYEEVFLTMQIVIRVLSASRRSKSAHILVGKLGNIINQKHQVMIDSDLPPNRLDLGGQII